jgi:HSP20 family protein
MQTHLWNPWSIFDELERSLFAAARSPEWPPFDIEDTDDETVFTADLPGMGEDDIEVTVIGRELIVRGERKPRDGRYVQRRRFAGSFERRFWIGDSYDPDHVTAHIANGELTIRLEKTARARPRRIKLTSGLAAKVKGLLTSDRDKSAA